jgi:hypothetical protein
MKIIRQKFGSAVHAFAWLESISRLVRRWQITVDDDVCIPCFRLPYPITVTLPKGIRFRGLHTCEVKLNPKMASSVIREFSRFAKVLLGTADEAALLFDGHDSVRSRNFFFDYRRRPDEARVTLMVGLDWNNLDETKAVFGEYFTALKADIKMRKVGERIEYYPPPGIEVVKLSTNEKGQSNRLSVRRKESRPGELFERLMEIVNQSRYDVREMNMFLSYPFQKEQSDRHAALAVEALNAMKLPVKRIKCEVHCSIDSLQSIGALSRLREMDCDNSTLEQTVVKFITPGGLLGFVVVGATKTGFTTELHAQQAPDEEAFVKEMKLLLKEHLR